MQFDGDGQHDARYLTKMAEKMIEEQADVVIGSRFIEKEGFQRRGCVKRVFIFYPA